MTTRELRKNCPTCGGGLRKHCTGLWTVAGTKEVHNNSSTCDFAVCTSCGAYGTNYEPNEGEMNKWRPSK